MALYCNGFKGSSKRATFQAITHHAPDIIMGCESKIDGDISTYRTQSSLMITWFSARTEISMGAVYLLQLKTP